MSKQSDSPMPNALEPLQGSHLSIPATTRSFLSSVAVPVAPFELQPAPSMLQHKLLIPKPTLRPILTQVLQFKTVKGQVKEQGQVIVDMNGGAVIEEPLEVEAEQGEANSQAKEEQGHQAVPHLNLKPFLPVVPFQVKDRDTEWRESGDLGFSLPSQICHENILDSNQQADILNSPLSPFDTASIEGAEKFYYSRSETAMLEDGQCQDTSNTNHLSMYEGEHALDNAPMCDQEATWDASLIHNNKYEDKYEFNSAPIHKGEHEFDNAPDASLNHTNTYENEHEFDDAPMHEAIWDGSFDSNHTNTMEGKHKFDNAPMREATWDASLNNDHTNTYDGKHEFDNAPVHDYTWDVFFDMLSDMPTLPSSEVPIADHPHHAGIVEDSYDLLKGGANDNQRWFGHPGATDHQGVGDNYCWSDDNPDDDVLVFPATSTKDCRIVRINSMEMTTCKWNSIK
ncbi:hypothetical protein C8J55DRAFT_487581 [Lentinula edodes]|uniref:Uncharacterized protein n=1 Tax=Lentinula lateritia TaxID=40482 RepID=A0A9W9AMN6_9AGAR|nr:hypothetical protein C8J55DRAFT_487581 [Lentinula edodes]